MAFGFAKLVKFITGENKDAITGKSVNVGMRSYQRHSCRTPVAVVPDAQYETHTASTDNNAASTERIAPVQNTLPMTLSPSCVRDLLTLPGCGTDIASAAIRDVMFRTLLAYAATISYKMCSTELAYAATLS
eukprot:2133459-Rhodomonas_salina.1